MFVVPVGTIWLATIGCPPNKYKIISILLLKQCSQLYSSRCLSGRFWLFAFCLETLLFWVLNWDLCHDKSSLIQKDNDPSDFNTGFRIYKMWKWKIIFVSHQQKNHLCDVKTGKREIAWFSTFPSQYHPMFGKSHVWSLRIANSELSSSWCDETNTIGIFE